MLYSPFFPVQVYHTDLFIAGIRDRNLCRGCKAEGTQSESTNTFHELILRTNRLCRSRKGPSFRHDDSAHIRPDGEALRLEASASALRTSRKSLVGRLRPDCRRLLQVPVGR